MANGSGTGTQEQAPPAKGKALALTDMLAQQTNRLKNLLPEYVSPERYLSLAMLAVNRSPQLQQAARERPDTIVQAVLTAAQAGLEIGGVVPGAHLVPFREQGKMTCVLVPDYRGLLGLAVATGSITSGDAVPVFKGERFKVIRGTNPALIHEPDFASIDDALAKPADSLVAVYFVGSLPDGKTKFHVMTKAQVDGIRARSRAKDSGPWVTDYIAMALKTVCKQFLKFVPMNPMRAEQSRRLASAIEADNRFESGDAGSYMDFENEQDASRHAAQQTRNRMDDLKERMGAHPTGQDVTEQSQVREAEPPPPEPTPEDQRKTKSAAHSLLIDSLGKHGFEPDAEEVASWLHYQFGKKTVAELAQGEATKAVRALERGDVPKARSAK